MPEVSSKDSQYHELLKKALVQIREQKAELESLRTATKNSEDIAIVGMGCRFPGDADSPAKFFNQLLEGIDPVTETPADRWAVDRFHSDQTQAKGKSYNRYGGYLSGDVYGFDPRFFGISPREAMAMDPQHRMMLETCWEAIENAGIAPTSLRGTNAGVFLGLMTQDHAVMAMADLNNVEAYTAAGNGIGVCAGRVAHTLGTNGPTLSVDTACSSSLVSLHLACQALHNNETGLAIAGGVNLHLSPAMNVMMCQANALAADGRCKTFDEEADGYGRSEGCGVVVLKRLSEAQRDNDRIYAVIKSSAVNHDGHSSALPVPNGRAQQAVMAEALRKAGLKGSDVFYVEAHGTGTQLGDPIEVDAIQQVYGTNRSMDQPVYVGSVKSNIGHTEAASGIAGVIKSALALRHRIVPGNLHFRQPSSLIPWESCSVSVIDRNLALELDGQHRIGISSFGFSGTNAHVILEEYRETAADIADTGVGILKLSAHSREGLKQLTQRCIDQLRLTAHSPAGLIYTLNTGRDDFPVRAFCSYDAANTGALIAELESLLHNDSTALASPDGQPQFLLDESSLLDLAERLPFDKWAAAPSAQDALKRCHQALQERVGLGICELDEHQNVTALTVPDDAQALKRFVLGYAFFKYWLVLSGESFLCPSAEPVSPALAVLNERQLGAFLEVLVGQKSALDTTALRRRGVRLDCHTDSRNGEAYLPVMAFGCPLHTERDALQAYAQAIGAIYLAGGNINWRIYYQDEKHPKSDAPTSVFDRVSLRSPWTELTPALVADPELIAKREESGLMQLINAPLPEEEKRAAITQSLVERIAIGLGHDAGLIHTDHSLFEIGVHSLQALEVKKSIELETGVEIPLVALLNEHTIASLADAVFNGFDAGKAAAPEHSTVQPDHAPLSLSQQGLWTIQTSAKDCAAYNIVSALKLSPTIEIDRLYKAIETVQARHDSLNLVFGHEDGRLVQHRVHDAPQISILHQAGLSEDELDRLIAREADQPFDLAEGPCVRHLIIVNNVNAKRHIYLCVIAHHIAVDFWSFGVLFSEINTAYQNPESLPQRVSSYFDYVAQEQHWLNGEDASRCRDYWGEYLNGSPVLSLPTDFDRPSVQRYDGFRLHRRLDSDASERLRETAKTLGVTPFLLYLGIYNLFLRLYSGQDDLVVGVPFFGRDLAGFESTIGHFVNVLPLRCHMDDSESLTAFLHSLKANYIESLKFSRLPFGEIVNECAVEYDPSRFPLCQAMFVWHEPSTQLLDKLQHDSVFSDPLSVSGQRGAPNDLILEVMDDQQQFDVGLSFSSALFSAATAEQMISQFMALIPLCLEHMGQSISAINQIPASVHAQLERWNRTERQFSGSFTSVPQRIYEQCEHSAERVAVRFSDSQLTYSELNHSAQRVRAALEKHGIQPGDRVAMALPRSPMLIPAVLGILYAGGVYCPVDPLQPVERLRHQLEDAKPCLVLIDQDCPQELLDLFDSFSIQALPPSAIHACPPSTELPIARARDDAAYVIFTSGSTGRPKGVVNTHGGIENRLLWQSEALDLQPDDRILQKTPLTFDVSVWELLWPFLGGARLIVLEPELHKQPQALAETIDCERISICHFVPSMLSAFLEELDRPLDSLRIVVASGEQLTSTLRDRFFRTFGSCRLMNLYGPTEASIDVTCHECRREDEGSAVPIGKPIANLQMHVLDSQLRSLPVGVKGELYISGIGLAVGYINQSALTEERFIIHPETRTRMYKTGDIGRYLPDGAIQFLGRCDDQVKLRGVRIELGDIEAKLASNQWVSDCAVFVDASRQDRRLSAVVVPDKRRLPMLTALTGLIQDHNVDLGRLREMENGMSLFQLNSQETDFIYREIFEENCYLAQGISIQPGDLIMDVGSNIGLFALLAGSLVGESGAVHAYEPIPEIFYCLDLNKALYPFPIVCHQKGIGRNSEETEFSFYPHNSLISGKAGFREENRQVLRDFARLDSVTAPEAGAMEHMIQSRLEEEKVVVSLTSISDEIERLGLDAVDLLKIDVERSEEAVLDGVRDEHWPMIRQLVIETENQAGVIERISQRLQDKGYSVRCPESQQAFVILYASRDDGPELPNEPVLPQWPYAGPRQVLKQIKDECCRQLPSYMIPDQFFVAADLPKNPSGKLDRPRIKKHQWISFATQQSQSPRSPLEVALLSLWGELLGQPIHDVEVGFYDLGGHSLSMVKLADRVRRQFDVTLSSAQMLKGFSVRELADWIGQFEHGGAGLLEKYSAGSPNSPAVILVAPLSGSTLCYRPLIETLEGACRVFGLNPIDGKGHIQTMAAEYVQAIHRQFDSRDDICLVGWSYGGVVAQEIARQLAPLRQPRIRLLMIDAFPWEQASQIGEGSLLLHNLFDALGTTMPLAAAHLVTLPAEDITVDAIMASLVAKSRQGFDRDEVERRLAQVRHGMETLKHHTAEVSHVEAQLFSASDSPFEVSVQRAYWQSLIPNLRSFFLPGGHFDLLNPENVIRVKQELFEQLRLETRSL